MSNTVKRGRPRKVMSIKTVKMNDLSFSKGLFKPMRTKTKVDEFFSSDKGVMPGTNVVITGDPGVGKTTVLLDVLADLQKNGTIFKGATHKDRKGKLMSGKTHTKKSVYLFQVR